METFVYPNFKTFYRNAGYLSEQYLKFRIRRILFRREVAEFERFVNECSERQGFFAWDPSETYPLLHTFLDKRFDVKQRLAAIQYDFQTAFHHFGVGFRRKICGGQAVLLAELNEGFGVWFGRNDNHVAEGRWAVSLRDQAGKRLYSATFAFVKPNALLIASVQGPAGADGRAIVRELTKKLYGLRPQQLLPQVLQKMAECWGIGRILGIAHAHQVKLRWQLKKRVAMNYDEFWQEARAIPQCDGYWHLPAAAVRKSEAEIESKKRSMYRKRYAMLDRMFADIANSLSENTDFNSD